jgi:hypothetical protein
VFFTLCPAEKNKVWLRKKNQATTLARSKNRDEINNKSIKILKRRGRKQ